MQQQPNRIANRKGVISVSSLFNTVTDELGILLPQAASGQTLFVSPVILGVGQQPRIMIRRFETNGSIIAESSKVISDDASTEKRHVAGATLSNGHNLIVWLTITAGQSLARVDGVIVDAVGTPITGMTSANTVFLPAGTASVDSPVRVSVFTDGHFALSYFDKTTGTHKAQKFTNAGAGVGARFALSQATQPITASHFLLESHQVGVTSDNQLQVLTTEQTDSGARQAVARKVSSTGAETQANTVLKTCPSCTTVLADNMLMDSDDTSVVVFKPQADGTNRSVARISSSLTVVGGEQPAPAFAGIRQPMCWLGDGSLMLVTHEAAGVDNFTGKVLTKQLASAGDAFPIGALPIPATLYTINAVAIAPTAQADSFIVAWPRDGLRLTHMTSKNELTLSATEASPSYFVGDAIDAGRLVAVAGNQRNLELSITHTAGAGQFNLPSITYAGATVSSTYDAAQNRWQATGSATELKLLLAQLQFTLTAGFSESLALQMQVTAPTHTAVSQPINVTPAENIKPAAITTPETINDSKQADSSASRLVTAYVQTLYFANGSGVIVYGEINTDGMFSADFYLQPLGSNGKQVGNSIKLTTHPGETTVSLQSFGISAAIDSSNTLHVQWVASEVASGKQVTCHRRANAAGTLLDTKPSIALTETVDGTPNVPRQVKSPLGGTVVVHRREKNGANQLQLQRMATTGGVQGVPVTLAQSTFKAQLGDTGQHFDFIFQNSTHAYLLYRASDTNQLRLVKLSVSDFSEIETHVVFDSGAVSDEMRCSLTPYSSTQALIVFQQASTQTIYGIYYTYATGALSSVYPLGKLHPNTNARASMRPPVALMGAGQFAVLTQDAVTPTRLAVKLFDYPAKAMGSPVGVDASAFEQSIAVAGLSRYANDSLQVVWARSATSTLVASQFYTGPRLALRTPANAAISTAAGATPLTLGGIQVATRSAEAALTLSISDPSVVFVPTPPSNPPGITAINYNMTDGTLQIQGQVLAINDLLSAIPVLPTQPYQGVLEFNATANDAMHAPVSVVYNVQVVPDLALVSTQTQAQPAATTTTVVPGQTPTASAPTTQPIASTTAASGVYTGSETQTQGNMAPGATATASAASPSGYTATAVSGNATNPTQTSPVATTMPHYDTGPLVASHAPGRVTPPPIFGLLAGLLRGVGALGQWLRPAASSSIASAQTADASNHDAKTTDSQGAAIAPVPEFNSTLMLAAVGVAAVNKARQGSDNAAVNLAPQQRSAYQQRRSAALAKLEAQAKPYYYDTADYPRDEYRWALEDLRERLTDARSEDAFNSWDRDFTELRVRTQRYASGESRRASPRTSPLPHYSELAGRGAGAAQTAGPAAVSAPALVQPTQPEVSSQSAVIGLTPA